LNTLSAPPTPLSAFASIAAAIASFALLLRLLLTVFASSQDTWLYIAEIASLFILVLAGVVAVFQTNLRTFLACAAVSQFAFMLLGLVSANATGIYGIAFYALAYVFMLAGVYLALSLLRQNDGVVENVIDLRGLYQRNLAVALLLAIFLLSLAGIPFTSGFLAKYSLLKSLVETHHTKLAIAAIILFLPTLFACVRVAVQLFRPAPAEQPRLAMSSAQAIALGICLFVTLAAGLYAEPFTRLAQYAFGQ
jgi:NADH-quinone oxidoreductase subunit N